MASDAASGAWSLRVVNQTSVGWYVQMARAVEVVGEDAASAQLLQMAFCESAYTVPEGRDDVLRVKLPAEFELAPLEMTKDGRVRVLPHDHHRAPLGRTFVHGASSPVLQQQPAVPLITCDRVVLDSAISAPTTSSSRACTGILQDGALIGGVVVDLSTSSVSGAPVSVQLRVSDQYYYRLLGSKGSLDKPVGQQWASGDWRPAPSPLRAGRELRVRVHLTDEGELAYEELEGAAPASDHKAAATPCAAQLLHPLILTGDVTLASTQLVLLVLLEKQLSFRLKHVPTSELPLAHPLRSNPEALPFLNVRATASRSDGSERRGGAFTLTQWLDERYRTGTRLTPSRASEVKEMHQRLVTTQRDILPLVDTLLQQLLYGPAQGHVTKPRVVADATTKLSAALDELQCALLEAAVASVATTATLADLALLPAMTLLQRTSAATLVDERLHLARWLAHMQRRSAWCQLSAWLDAHVAKPRLDDFVQGEAGAAFSP